MTEYEILVAALAACIVLIFVLSAFILTIIRIQHKMYQCISKCFDTLSKQAHQYNKRTNARFDKVDALLEALSGQDNDNDTNMMLQ